MKISKQNIIKSCCGNNKIIFTLENHIKSSDLSKFSDAGFTILQAYKDAGMLYAENSIVTIIATIGQNLLTIKLKNKDTKLENIIEILEKI